MLSNVLVDSNFLLSVYDQSERYHQFARRFLQNNNDTLVFPEIILAETTYLIRRNSGIHAVSIFLRQFVALNPVVQSLETDDLLRASDIITKYSEADFDFVDSCIMALSERLNITKVCTFDRRDFSIFRPKHCPFLELLP